MFLPAFVIVIFMALGMSHGLLRVVQGLALAVLVQAAGFVWTKAKANSLRRQLLQLQAQLQHEQTKRQADRTGRVRAEQELKRLQGQLAQLNASTLGPQHGASSSGSAGANRPGEAGSTPNDNTAASNAVWPAYPFRPLGYISSCFSQRNGTPRQPLLVGAARSRLTLAPHVPASCLEGLEQYSHVWLLYVFHENTDMAKSFCAGHVIKGKIGVPRLNGARMGVLATRSPHRPSPIGLSVAGVVRVEGRAVVLSGADVVDGSPVLDIKPYVPFCDSVPSATAPAWVAAEAEEEPLRVGGLRFEPGAAEALASSWRAAGQQAAGLYPTAQEFQDLVVQVLSRDIRSVHQRSIVPAAQVAARRGGSSSSSAEAQQSVYHVVLCGVDVGYRIDRADAAVCVVSATATSRTPSLAV